MSFLDEFVGKLQLLDKDKEHLIKDRGFTESTIEECRFKSCGPYIRDIIIGLDGFYDINYKTHKIIDDNGYPNRQLLQNNILIPYLDAAGHIYKIRPHKLGFKGDSIDPYCQHLFNKEETNLIITEGEFKAAAGHQYEFNTIAVPGISSFSKNHFEELLSFLSGSKIKEISILFDSEDKSNPEYKNYKKDWKSRYDTDIYSYIMAEQLQKNGFNAKVASFPKEWREDGKIDFDGCLGQGRSRADIKNVIDAGKNPKQFLNSLHYGKKEEAYIKRRIERFFYESKIRRSKNCYWFVKDEDSLVKISNFVINIEATYYETDGTKLREVTIINEFGEESEPTVLSPEMMTSKQSFMRFCYSRGNYNYMGNDFQLGMIWEWEFMCDEGNTIYDIDHVGKLDHRAFKKDVWFFGNVMWVDDEKLYPSNEKIYWMDNVGMRVKPLAVDEHAAQLPCLNLDPVDKDEIVKHLFNVGGERAKLLLGWVVFVLLAPYLPYRKINPFPFVYGEKGEGKSTLCSYFMAILGMEDWSSTTMTDITIVAITRLMGYYSSLPVWIDEFQRASDTLKKESHLKSVYNKVPVVKGTRNKFGISTYKIRSQLMLSGQTMPMSDALKSRCILVHMILNRGAHQSYLWLENNKEQMSNIAVQILNDRIALAKNAETYIDQYYEAICGSVADVDVRTARHYAIFSGCYKAFMGADVKYDEQLQQQVYMQREMVGTDEVEKFFDDMMVLHIEGKIDKDYYKMNTLSGEIEVWLKGVYEQWVLRYNKSREMYGFTTIKQLFSKKSYCVECNRRVQLGNATKRCVVLRYDECPEQIRNLVDGYGGRC